MERNAISVRQFLEMQKDRNLVYYSEGVVMGRNGRQKMDVSFKRPNFATGPHELQEHEDKYFQLQPDGEAVLYANNVLKWSMRDSRREAPSQENDFGDLKTWIPNLLRPSL